MDGSNGDNGNEFIPGGAFGAPLTRVHGSAGRGRHLALRSPATRIRPGLPCGLTPGTMIDTRHGPVAVEALEPGMQILTRDSGYRALRWIGRAHIDATVLDLRPEQRPVCIPRDSIAPGIPESDLQLAPRHGVLVSDAALLDVVGEREALSCAHHLARERSVASGPLEYFILCLDSHQLIRANGAWVESFLPSERALRALTIPERDRLFASLPALRHEGETQRWPQIRRVLQAAEMSVLRKAADPLVARAPRN